MAKSKNTLKAVLEDTAAAIKTKKGSSSPITPRDFADEIASIPAGDDSLEQLMQETF